MLSLGLYRMCKRWFQNNNGSGNIGKIRDYSEAHVSYYFLVLLGIVVFGACVNLLPPVREWIQRVEKTAARASGSAASTPKVERRKKSDDKLRETDPLLAAQEHVKYLEEGKEPHIYRMNTMKAEFSKPKKLRK